MALLSQGMVVKDGAKMSKSKGNVVDPDELIRTLGADTARLFSLFAAPPEKDLDWNDHGVEGASRFLNRIWRFVLAHVDEMGGGETGMKIGGGEAPFPIAPPGRARDAARGATVGGQPLTATGRAFRRVIHETIQRVTHDLEDEFHFNTAVSAIMELVNALYAFEAASLEGVPRGERLALLREAVESITLLLGPFCPHLAEEVWLLLGHKQSVFRRPWPTAEAAALARDEVTLVVQVDGKVRSRLVVDVGTARERVERLALDDDKVRPWVESRRIARVVVVANRLVNIVTAA
jgi:leucyl-tRNA synthetase